MPVLGAQHRLRLLTTVNDFLSFFFGRSPRRVFRTIVAGYRARYNTAVRQRYGRSELSDTIISEAGLGWEPTQGTLSVLGNVFL